MEYWNTRSGSSKTIDARPVFSPLPARKLKTKIVPMAKAKVGKGKATVAETSPPGSPDFKPGSPGFSHSPRSPALELGETAASACYVEASTRLNVQPEPRLLSTLRDPRKYGGVYSTADAEQLLCTDALSAAIECVTTMRGLHTLRLVGLRQGDTPFFTHAGLGALVRAVRENDSIRSLDLSDDALDDELAAAHLGTLLARNGSLTALQLRHNSLREKCGRQVLQALASNKQLQTLDLSCNPSAVLLLPEIEKLLTDHGTLRDLGCSVPAEKALALLAALLKLPQRLPCLRLVRSPLLPCLQPCAPSLQPCAPRYEPRRQP